MTTAFLRFKTHIRSIAAGELVVDSAHKKKIKIVENIIQISKTLIRQNDDDPASVADPR
jgi:hypothetical protein